VLAGVFEQMPQVLWGSRSKEKAFNKQVKLGNTHIFHEYGSKVHLAIHIILGIRQTGLDRPSAPTSGKGNLQMIKKTPHFVLNFLQVSTFLLPLPELTPEFYKTTAFHHVLIQY
jgi:hypothetical protein